MKRVVRLLLGLAGVVIILIVAGVLLLDPIMKQVVQRRLRAETGMDAKIGKLEIGLRTPTILIENLKLNNTPEFGGTPFLDIPELYVEYDKDAFRAGNLHLKLVRLNMAEIDIIKDKHGRLNIEGIKKKSRTARDKLVAESSGFKFTGLDTLNITFQKLRLSNLDAPAEAQEIDFGVANEVFHDIKSPADLMGMAVVLAARGAARPSSNASPIDLPQLLGRLAR